MGGERSGTGGGVAIGIIWTVPCCIVLLCCIVLASCWSFVD